MTWADGFFGTHRCHPAAPPGRLTGIGGLRANRSKQIGFAIADSTASQTACGREFCQADVTCWRR
jgi:hypothetical protein